MASSSFLPDDMVQRQLGEILQVKPKDLYANSGRHSQGEDLVTFGLAGSHTVQSAARFGLGLVQTKNEVML